MATTMPAAPTVEEIRKRSKVTVDAIAIGAGGTDTATRKIKLRR